MATCSYVVGKLIPVIPSATAGCSTWRRGLSSRKKKPSVAALYRYSTVPAPNVANRLGQALGGPLHCMDLKLSGLYGGSFSKDLLETPLSGAIQTVEGDGIAVLVADNLHF
jgi:hypothetical protein